MQAGFVQGYGVGSWNGPHLVVVYEGHVPMEPPVLQQALMVVVQLRPACTMRGTQ